MDEQKNILKRRAQSSVEYIALLGFLMLIIILLFIQSQTTAQSKIIDTKVLLAVEKLAQTADEVYRLGPGTKLHVDIDLPENVKESIIGPGEIGFRVYVPEGGGGTTDVVKFINADVIAGEVSPDIGLQSVPLEMLDSGAIIIGCALTLEDCPVTLQMARGSSTTLQLNLTNGCNTNFSGLAPGVGGDLAPWLSTDLGASELGPAESAEVNVSISVDGGASEGSYAGYVSISGGNAYIECPITVVVPDTDDPTVNSCNPSGTIDYAKPTVSFYSSEPATCKGSLNTDETYENMDFDFSGTGLYHTYIPAAPLSDGTQRFYVKCRDASGNTMGSSHVCSFRVNVTRQVTDTEPPTVFLHSPSIVSGNVTFSYTPNDADSGIANCVLIIGGIVDQTDNTITEGSVNYFYKVMSPGSYNWSVNCTDDSPAANEGASATWLLTITQGGGLISGNYFTVADTQLYVTKPTSNYGGSPNIESEPVNVKKLMLLSDISGIPPTATVESAKFMFYCYGGNGGDSQHNIYRITRSWVEGTENGASKGTGASWNTYDGTNAWSTPGGDYDPYVWSSMPVASGSGWTEFDVRDLVQSWVNGTYTNYGIIVTSVTPGAGKKSFYSREISGANYDKSPHFAVTYQ